MDIKRLDYLSPFKKRRVPRSLAGQLRQPRSFTRLDFSSEQRAEDAGSWLDDHLPYYVEALPQASGELDWVTMSGLDNPTLECTCQTFHAYTNEDGEHDCAHCILLEHEEAYFRGKQLLQSPDEQGDIFPISNKSGVVVAYINDAEVISVAGCGNNRTLCCGHEGDGKKCRHVSRVKEYEEKYRVHLWSAAELAFEDSTGDGSDLAAFIDNHPCLPTHLERGPTDRIRKAMLKLHDEGRECFPAPPNSMHLGEPVSNGTVDTRAMFPPLPPPSHLCKCEHHYQHSGYTLVNEKCSMYWNGQNATKPWLYIA
ncbi:hypothetical protein NADE_009303 [Nannochloris sp. 'desiccata']|nr:hypothetical protein KSW81_005954 [Chlorella desiccata (nom. nud.)]KAH7621258.1 hypothetical protein NADE_009303 [Chlorella desiccata (nom. nud.)]